MKNLIKILIGFSVVAFISCDPKFDDPVDEVQVTSGDADFSKYVAIGNSLTAGYADNALYSSGQENSYPNMLAGSMAMAGGGAFTQPMMPDDIGGFSDLGEPGKLVLQIVEGALAPIPMDAQSPFTPASGGPFNNMGVPGAKSFHLVAPGYGNPAGIATGQANPYYARFASSPEASVMQDVLMQQPTFFSLWIGNNDVLSYATSGGVGVDQTGNPDPTTYGPNDITDPTLYGGVIQGILEQLVNQGGAKGVIANIPSITNIPFFTTVPHAPLDPSNPDFGNMIPALNDLFGQLNAVFDFLGAPERKIEFYTDQASPVVIKDKTLDDMSELIQGILIQQGMDPAMAFLLSSTYGQSRQATANDLLVLTSQSVIGEVDEARVAALMQLGVPQEQAIQLSVGGITYPLEDQWVLIPSETQAIINATESYNAILAQLAHDYELAFVDAHAAMEALSLEAGITYNGTNYTTTFVTGGAFSLDGVHLTGKGYAVVNNFFVQAINEKYGSTLPEVNPNRYPGVIIP